REMNENGASSWREARQQMRIGIAGKQRGLEEHHRDRPDSCSAAQPRQHHLGEHRLDRKQQCGTRKDDREKGCQQPSVRRGGGLRCPARGELGNCHVPNLCALERDDFSSNRHPALTYSWCMISSEPVSTSWDRALAYGEGLPQ